MPLRNRLPLLKICVLSSLLLLTASSAVAADKQSTSIVVGKTPLSQLLHWINDPKSSDMCHGYYIDYPVNFPANLPDDYYVLHADHSTLFRDKPSLYQGNVMVKQPQRELLANKAYTYYDPKAKRITEIKAYGNVRMREPGVLIVANSADMHVVKNQMTLHKAAYRLLRDKTPIVKKDKNGETVFHVQGLNARGEADTAIQTKPNMYKLHNATYSTCKPSSHTWELHSGTMDINNKTKDVSGTNVTMWWHGVPFLYTPYMTFSYDQTRRSGLLMPLLGYTSNNGVKLGLPFYLNISPNYDMTFTPIYYGTRGWQLNDLFRYKTWNSEGNLYVSALPGDRTFKNFKENAPHNYPNAPGLNRLEQSSDSRGYISWQHGTQFNQYWSALINFNYVSDDYYFQDFGDTPADTTQGQLPEQAQIQFQSQHWNFLTQLLNYETLHPVNSQGFQDQYARWPDVNASASYPDEALGLTYNIGMDYSYFRHPVITDHYNVVAHGMSPTVGSRFDINPSVNLPEYKSWGYINPELQWDNTGYILNQWFQPGGPQNNLQNKDILRSVPIFDIDTGLYFDRKASLFGHHFTETLEPRLFYLYVPYVNQSNIPLFDTSSQLFTYNSIFQTNRFIGTDRIGDTNQLGVGLTSRFFNDKNGNELFDASIGEIVYFANRQVTLNNQYTPNDDTAVSPIAAQLNYYITPQMTLTGDIAYDPVNKAIADARANFGFRIDGLHTFNIGYSYQRYDALNIGQIAGNSTSNINDITTSFAWPLIWHWHVMGQLDYNLAEQYAQDYLAGVEYDSCCWAFRVITSRQFTYLSNTNAPQYDTDYYVEWLFKGFTSVGSTGTSKFLQSQIPGYQDTFDSPS